MSSKRLFFALWPDHRQRDRMRDFISPLAKEIEGRAIDRRNWHITLAYIGEFPEQLIPALQNAASAIVVEPFRLRFDRLEFWPRPKVASVVTRTVPAELQMLVQALNGVLLKAGIVVEERTYRPHITVVRNARPFEPLRLAQSAEIEWDSFRLIESVSQPGGAVYSPIDQ
jgi:2'-5' RNA ligase